MLLAVLRWASVDEVHTYVPQHIPPVSGFCWLVIGDPLEYERRISTDWSALHARGARLTPKCLSIGAWWERWLRRISPVLAFGSWRWLWSDTTKSALDVTVNRMIRNRAMGIRTLECWLKWHSRTLRAARAWGTSKLGGTCFEWLLRLRHELGVLARAARVDPHPAEDGLAACRA